LEIAALHELGRVRLTSPLREWLDAATARPLGSASGITSLD
jgi:hypothetical protein